MKTTLFTIAARMAAGLALLVSCTALPAAERFVSLTGGHVAPFLSWDNAATNIQAAIDAASVGDVIWVTNGIYSKGGKVKEAGLTNRIAVDKPVTVRSVNGAAATVIEGHIGTKLPVYGGLDSTAVRCVWLGANAVLDGFTLRNGATRSAAEVGDGVTTYGGGVAGETANPLPLTNMMVLNCVISSNLASGRGGGAFAIILSNCWLTGNTAVGGASYSPRGGAAYGCTLRDCSLSLNHAGAGGGTFVSTLIGCGVFGNTADTGGGSSQDKLSRCVLVGNSAASGGGTHGSTLNACAVLTNTASTFGGGCYSSTLVNCSVLANAAQYGGGIYGGKATNSIVWANAGSYGSNYYSATIAFSCSNPLPSGQSNTCLDPLVWMDGVHLFATSPCRGIGTGSVAAGADFDEEPWANPPSMGCDEVYEAALTGPLTVAIQPQWTELPARVGQTLTGIVTGRAAQLEWSFGDGPTVTNVGWLAAHTWTNAGDYTVTLTAFNADNPAGVLASVMIHVVPVAPPLLSAGVLTSNVFQLTFPGQTNVTWIVESATNLAPPTSWQMVQTLTGTGSPVSLQFPNTTNDARFYRLRQP